MAKTWSKQATKSSQREAQSWWRFSRVSKARAEYWGHRKAAWGLKTLGEVIKQQQPTNTTKPPKVSPKVGFIGLKNCLKTFSRLCRIYDHRIN